MAMRPVFNLLSPHRGTAVPLPVATRFFQLTEAIS